MYRLLRKIEDGKGDVKDLTNLENTCSLLEGEKVYCHLLKGAILSVKNTIKHFRNEFETHINNRKCPLHWERVGVRGTSLPSLASFPQRFLSGNPEKEH